MTDDHAAAQEHIASPVFESQPRLPLSVGTLISDSFAVFFHHIVVVCLIGLVPMLLGQVLPDLVLGYYTGFGEIGSDAFDTILLPLVMTFLLLAVYSITTAILVQLACDDQLGRQIRIRRYIRPAIRALPAILILSFAVLAILVLSQIVVMLFSFASHYLALVALPFQFGFVLWIVAVFSVCAPAVIFEQSGLRGLTRSAELTWHYRWPIVGTLVLISLLIAVFYLVVGAIFMVLSMATNGLIGGLLFGLLSTAGTSILAIAVSLIYARLREIKGGVGLESISEVFD
ncbi:hypothetical protein [Labrenzia sp. OB1]|uniref:hypothetical protein n=1 Tax=Labrenzia sp. OB1 TaxID=1561204 RepID=UPI0007B1A9C5|nr:hypothetical protein [Labrenzia sp. OB1]KZM51008.1 hypothetical protein OA90_04740 [Labrenzia sp. OB1]